MLGQGILVMVISVIVPWLLVFRDYPEESYIHILILILIQAIIVLPVVYLSVFDRVEKASIVDTFFSWEKKRGNN